MFKGWKITSYWALYSGMFCWKPSLNGYWKDNINWVHPDGDMDDDKAIPLSEDYGCDFTWLWFHVSFQASKGINLDL